MTQRQIRSDAAMRDALASDHHVLETRLADGPQRASWSIAETGVVVHGSAFWRWRNEGLLEPVGDGLFGASQTFRARADR